MSKLFSLVAGWKGYAALAVACLLVGAGGTWRVMSWREGAHQTDVAVATTRLVVHQADIQADLGAIYVPEFVFIQSETQRRISEVPQHVMPEIDRAYPLPLGFVRVRNDAAHGPVPPAAAGRDADPSGVHLSELAAADVRDEGTLDLCRKMNDEWWSWYDQHKAAWDSARNSVGQ